VASWGNFSKKIKIVSIVGVITLLIMPFFYLPLLNIRTQYRNGKKLTKIASVNSLAATVFSDFITDIERETDWKVMIVSGYRTEAEQAILKKINAKNASPGKSEHNLGKAIDICLYKKHNLIFVKWVVKSTGKNIWENTKILKIAEKYNLKWGGNFKNYYDPVHFEIE
jgi:D-alanyl-D-alanine carboxypeptidase